MADVRAEQHRGARPKSADDSHATPIKPVQLPASTRDELYISIKEPHHCCVNVMNCSCSCKHVHFQNFTRVADETCVTI